MDYQEAIYCMKVLAGEEVCEECNYYHSCDHAKQADMARIAISAIQELQEYRQIDQECIQKTGCGLNMLSHKYLEFVEGIAELYKYREIGTLEEVREAMEKQTAKKPIIQPWSPARCPTCGEELSENLGDGYYRHRTFLERCTNVECAQRLDWSEEE